MVTPGETQRDCGVKILGVDTELDVYRMDGFRRGGSTYGRLIFYFGDFIAVRVVLEK